MWFNLVLIIITLALYLPSLKYGFFQDDFLHLVNTQTSLSGLLKFFTDNSAIYYRPLGIQFPFWLQQRLFGSRTAYWHLFSLLIHLANAFLVRRLILKLTAKKHLANLASLLYATSAIHFISLFWLSETNLLLGALLLFSNLNLYLEEANLFYVSGRLLLTLPLFIIGLLTHEIMIIFPALALLFRRARLNYFLSLLAISIVYLAFRFFILPIPISGTYTPHLNSNTLSSLIWYGLWSINLPEEFKYQFVLSQLQFQPKFITSFILQLTIWLSGLTIMVGLVLINFKALIKQSSLTILGLGWFLIGISLFLFLPLHQYPMYALAGLPGLTLILASIAPKRPLGLAIFLLAWLTASFTTLRFSELTHWTVQEARRVEDISSRSQKKYPEFPPYSTLIIKTDYQVNQSLFDQLGLQYLYQDSTLTTYYGDFHDLIPQQCAIMEKQKKNIRPCLAQHGLYLLD